MSDINSYKAFKIVMGLEANNTDKTEEELKHIVGIACLYGDELKKMREVKEERIKEHEEKRIDAKTLVDVLIENRCESKDYDCEWNKEAWKNYLFVKQYIENELECMNWIVWKLKRDPELCKKIFVNKSGLRIRSLLDKNKRFVRQIENKKFCWGETYDAYCELNGNNNRCI